MTITVLLMFSLLTACQMFGDDTDVSIPDNDIPERIPLDSDGHCPMEEGYVLVDDECVLLDRDFSGRGSFSREEFVHIGKEQTAAMDELVADLSGSVGLAVMSRSLFETHSPYLYTFSTAFFGLLSTNDEDDAENVFVKLLEEGVFEEIAFLDEDGQEVAIDLNPLVLEVFGAYTVVAFEMPMEGEPEDLQHQVNHSFHYGGVYLIHNETGKVFATQEVHYHEHVSSETESFAKMVTVTVTLHEPVMREAKEYLYDEEDNPVLDDEDNHLYDIVLVPVLDENDEPLVFTEGPILTATVEVPLYEHYLQQVYEDGEPVFDDDGEPVYEEVSEPVLDEEGDPVYVTEEVAVLDEDGHVQYLETFEITLDVVEYVTHTEIHYEAYAEPTPLGHVVHLLLNDMLDADPDDNMHDRNAHDLIGNRVVAGAGTLYYKALRSTLESGAEGEIVVRISYDDETDELVLEEHMNITAAGFTDCALFVDPDEGIVFCFGDDLRIFTPEHGLATIEGIEQPASMSMPNGKLYFYSLIQSEESSFLMHRITPEGTIEDVHIELPENIITCENAEGCLEYHVMPLFDDAGEEEDYHRMVTSFAEGDALFDRVRLSVQSVDVGSSSEICEEAEGCTLLTSNFTVVDDAEEAIALAAASEYAAYPVHFAYGDTIPDTEDFHVTYVVEEFGYLTERVDVYELQTAFSQFRRLDDHFHFLHYDAGSTHELNVILQYDETTDRYRAMYTNMFPTLETAPLGEGYVGINMEKTAIYHFAHDESASSPAHYNFTIDNLTGEEDIHEVNDLAIDYDGTVYFKAVDRFIAEITGTIEPDGTIIIDTEYTEREIIRLRPIN